MHFCLKITVLAFSCALFAIAAGAQQQPAPFDAEKARMASQINHLEEATRAYLDFVPQEAEKMKL